MLLPLLATVFCLLAACYFLWRKNLRPTNCPPGPTGLPFIGSVLSLGYRPHLTILKWKEQYGDTFSFYNAGQLYIVLSDFHTVRKIFGEEASTGRVQKSLMRQDTGLPMERGLVQSTGNTWKIHRRFALSTLRDLGMGKNWLEESMLGEVTELLQVLKDTEKRPFNPKARLTNSVSNVICALAFGKRFELTDPKFTRLTGLIAENIATIKIDRLTQAVPFLMWFPNPIKSQIMKVRQNLKDLREFLKGIIAEHDAVDRDAAVEDYIVAYRNEEEKGAKTDLKDSFDENQLISSLFDLFAAGTETTSTTTLWAMVFMIEHPDVMKKVQDEIDTCVGRERMLTTSDRAMLPYTEATILEVQRCASLVPLGVAHRANETLTIDGYQVPEGAVLFANLFSIQKDARYWKNPEEFDPTRFLDDEQKLLRPDGFAPFSIGKRACLGESLAKMELFLFIANILRSFTLELPPGRTLSHDDYYASLVNSPNPFELIFNPRT